MAISYKELLHGHVINDLSIKEQQNLAELQKVINQLIEIADWHPAIVTSGFRTEQDQLRINPKAPNSAHRLGMAVDILDKDGSKYKWCETNQDTLQTLGLWVEYGTKGWVHLQTRPAKNRIFKP